MPGAGDFLFTVFHYGEDERLAKRYQKGAEKVNRYISSMYKQSNVYKQHGVITDMDTFFGLLDGGSFSSEHQGSQ